MRIADITLMDLLSGQLQTQEQSIASLDSQVSSGLSIQKPSDNPMGTVDALSYQRQLARLSSYSSAAESASSWLGLANESVNTVLSTLQSTKSVVLQALNSGSQTTQTYQSFAQQLQGVFNTLIGLANTSYGGTAIFAGTAGVSAAYSPTGTYNGNSSSFMMQVAPNTSVAAGISGETLFGGGSSGTQDLFTTLNNTIKHLQAGPGAATESNLQADLNALSANVNLAENAATGVGESSKVVQSSQTIDTSSSAQMQTALSKTENADLGVLGPELQAQMDSYQAALVAVSRAIPETLAAYIK